MYIHIYTFIYRYVPVSINVIYFLVSKTSNRSDDVFNCNKIFRTTFPKQFLPTSATPSYAFTKRKEKGNESHVSGSVAPLAVRVISSLNISLE